ncbi:hypothetical protein KEJ47_10100 [Candidatus Bathyarchaeota archaeon]|nr:hypothetical protein [Candidatus Bathyarchaeota archaeon]
MLCELGLFGPDPSERNILIGNEAAILCRKVLKQIDKTPKAFSVKNRILAGSALYVTLKKYVQPSELSRILFVTCPSCLAVSPQKDSCAECSGSGSVSRIPFDVDLMLELKRLLQSNPK